MIANYTDLKGKNILVTGASRGLGKKMAEALATQGAHVIFNYRGDEAAAMVLKEELLKLGASNATALHFDVTNTPQMKEAVEKFIE
ncbi:MAG: SDR family NAD(P)-dependent oxidoreductase, partial [Bacteriovorax sp.]|nr:SDR family NAD(P)-dependent oxidoreductase [Bacteriovorax sp.]